MATSLVIPDFEKPDKRPFIAGRPEHTHICLACANGPALVNNMCEPCYRRIHCVPIEQELDKIYARMTVLLLSRVRHEEALKDAKVQYNKAVEQNWSCKRCAKHFDYYGDLFAHEKDDECKAIRKTAAPRRSHRDDNVA